MLAGFVLNACNFLRPIYKEIEWWPYKASIVPSPFCFFQLCVFHLSFRCSVINYESDVSTD